MTPERWQKINELFQATVEFEPERRAVFLDEACSTDEMLRSEVESLLASDEHEWKLIEQPALEVAAPLLADDQPRLASGQHIGHYEIVSLIGKGGMGEVYLAKDQKLNRKVALKLLPIDYTRNKDRLRRFQQEAQAASALNHPNILTIHELGEVEGQQFIATEFVEGETLRERLKRGRLNLPETLDIAIQIAGALVAAHKAGIVHRDIKPENIMLRHDGYAKVLDFGLAKLTEQHEPTPQPQVVDEMDISSGLVMGTVKYMSPEQARGLPVDVRTDIFSLGVVLYEMVTGRALWKGETPRALIKSILNDEPPRLREYLPEASEELQRVISKALTKEKAKRYQTADDLLIDLKTLEVERTSNIEYVVRLFRRHRIATALGLTALVVVLAGLAYPLKKWLGKRAAPFERTQITKLTTSGEVRLNGAISRDGKYVAYVLRNSDKRSLWIRQLATNSDLQIIPPSDAGLAVSTFTPDGKYVYYNSSGKVISGGPSGHTALFRISVSGGTAEKLIDDFDFPIAFSPDGNQFAFIRNYPSQGLGTLSIVSADGTNARTVANRRAPDYFNSGAGLSWSPDGKVIACVAVNASDGYQRVFEVNIETGAQKPLTSQKWDGGISGVAWLSDSSGLLLSAGESLHFQIWHLAYPNGELRRITNDTNNYGKPSLTADSHSLVTTQFEFVIEIWTMPEGDASRAKRITPGRHDGLGAWAPDGRIVYTSRTSGNDDIWIMNADGTNQKQLTTDVHNDTWPSVTPDGRFIVFQSNRTGADHIWRMDIDGGNQKQLTFGAVERTPNCTPDSRWIVFNAWESGKADVWKMSIDGGSPTQLTDVACFGPAVSPDGNLIACDSGKKPIQRLIIPFAGGKPIKALDIPGWTVRPTWTLDGRATTYFDTRNNVTNIWSQPIDGSPPKQLTNFTSGQKAASYEMDAYTWSPDGKQLAFTHRETRADLVLIRDLR